MAETNRKILLQLKRFCRFIHSSSYFCINMFLNKLKNNKVVENKIMLLFDTALLSHIGKIMFTIFYSNDGFFSVHIIRIQNDQDFLILVEQKIETNASQE